MTFIYLDTFFKYIHICTSKTIRVMPRILFQTKIIYMIQYRENGVKSNLNNFHINVSNKQHSRHYIFLNKIHINIEKAPKFCFHLLTSCIQKKYKKIKNFLVKSTLYVIMLNPMRKKQLFSLVH